MAESCHSRGFSWLVKPCIPDDPRRAIAASSTHRVRSSSATSSATSSTASATTISSLPDDLLLECLSRVPISSLPSLYLVCRRFSLLLSSPSFSVLRIRHGDAARPCFLAFSSSAGLRLSFSGESSFNLSSFPFSVPSDLPTGSFSHARTVALGRWIYLIGRAATLRFDTWTGSISRRSPTLFPRKKFAAAAVAGRIYIAGGSSRTSAVEEYDPETDTWRVASEAPRRRYGCIGTSAGRIFYVAGGLTVVGEGRSLNAHLCAGSIDAYHVASCCWIRTQAPVVPGGGCIVGACSAGENLYVLASHAVELSFWRVEAGVVRTRRFEWNRLEPPPVSRRAVLGGAVRFSCAAVGGDKVVASVHFSAVRGGGQLADVAAGVEGFVLVYDITSGEWTHGPELPPGYRRINCVAAGC